jgi:hypothetical protein
MLISARFGGMLTYLSNKRRHSSQLCDALVRSVALISAVSKSQICVSYIKAFVQGVRLNTYIRCLTAKYAKLISIDFLTVARALSPVVKETRQNGGN